MEGIMSRLFKTLARRALLGLLLVACLAATGQAAEDPVDALAAEATAAGVGADELDRVMALGFKYDLEREAVAGYVAVLRAAAEAGLPRAPFISKIEEGLAKRVPGPRILAVVNTKLERYGFTRELAHSTLERWGYEPQSLNSADLVAIAESLGGALDPEALAGFLRRAPAVPAPRLARAVEYLAALRQMSLEPSTADRIVLAGMEREFFSKPDWELAWVINEAKKAGIADEVIGATALAAVRQEKTLTEVCYSLGVDVEAVAQIFKDSKEMDKDIFMRGHLPDGGRGDGVGTGNGGKGNRGRGARGGGVC
jgi:hypothetical protein